MVRGKKWDGSFEKRSKWHIKPLTKFTLPRLSHSLSEEWQNKFIPVFLRSYFRSTMSLELQFLRFKAACKIPRGAHFQFYARESSESLDQVGLLGTRDPEANQSAARRN